MMIKLIKDNYIEYKKEKVITDFFFKKHLTDENNFELQLANIKKYYDIEDPEHIWEILEIISSIKHSKRADKYKYIAAFNLIQLGRNFVCKNKISEIYNYIPIFKFILNKIRYDYIRNHYQRIGATEKHYICIFLSYLKVNKDITNNNFDELISLCHFIIKEAYKDYNESIINLVFEKIGNIINRIDNNDIYKLKETVNFINSYYIHDIYEQNMELCIHLIPLVLLEQINENNCEIILELNLYNFRGEHDDILFNKNIQQFIEKCPNSNVSEYYNNLILKAIL